MNKEGPISPEKIIYMIDEEIPQSSGDEEQDYIFYRNLLTKKIVKNLK
tara:strand:- start:4718 stop:4861 length:144 start_codon:yes stop_codon:yes gene_type:complete